jgi:tripartite-type tricarboxylate transporter receptor subunit TctC
VRWNEYAPRVFAIGAAGATIFAAIIESIGTAGAQSYPSRPITMVVPFAAGGAADTLARTIADRMRAPLGQPIIIENVTSASGSIGAARVARASPDGYTLGYGTMGTHVINGAVLSLPYDVARDFQPIALMSNTPLLIVARKTMPAKDLDELVAWLKANPDKASMATSGVAAPSYLAGVVFQQKSGARFGLVPYRGSAAALQDLIAARIDMMIDPPASSLPPVRDGHIKAYAVTAKSRLAAAPDIPTVDEAGLPGLHVLNWTALFAPKGTPNAVVTKLNAAVVDALVDPAVRAKLAGFGFEFFPREQQTPEALAAFHKADIERWWPIIKAAGIKPE